MDVLLWSSNKKMPQELNPFLPLIGTKSFVLCRGRQGGTQSNVTEHPRIGSSQNSKSIFIPLSRRRNTGEHAANQTQCREKSGPPISGRSICRALVEMQTRPPAQTGWIWNGIGEAGALCFNKPSQQFLFTGDFGEAVPYGPMFINLSLNHEPSMTYMTLISDNLLKPHVSHLWSINRETFFPRMPTVWTDRGKESICVHCFLEFLEQNKLTVHVFEDRT